MTKCGKGCMPECQYFTTGGCVSPFNCPYNVEEIYSNSATSNTACYAGTSYTEAQADEAESGIRKWYRESVGREPANYDAAALKAYIAYLEKENEELKQRDIRCASSVAEMIASCDKCGLLECYGCEHSYTAVQEVKKLQVENVALRERLDKAVELPCKIGDTVYKVHDKCDGHNCPYNGYYGQWRCHYEGKQRCEPFISTEQFCYNHIPLINKTVFIPKEAAEARLAELKGEKK